MLFLVAKKIRIEEMSAISFISKIGLHLLYPISLLWEIVYRIRRFYYNLGIFKRNHFAVPIISVGNLTFGGTGKTPFTLWLAGYLEKKKKKVMILTRGYKGKLEHSSGILRADKKLGYNASIFGDEPLIFTRRLQSTSVVVGKRRSENLIHYFDQILPDVVLLDDGHQHLKISRNLNLVLFDTTMPLSRYRVAPLGYMREGFGALKDADFVILGRCDQVTEHKRDSLKKMILSHNGELEFAEIYYGPNGFYNYDESITMSLSEVKGKNVIAVAGVASPDSFFLTLEQLGAKLVGKKVFSDHHDFKKEEITQIISEAEDLEALIITTEKDIVKIRRITGHERIYFLEVKVCFLSGEDKIERLVESVISP